MTKHKSCRHTTKNPGTSILCGLSPFFLIFTLTFLLISSPILGQTESVPDARIDIEAATSRITWDEDIIRSWDASGNVVVTYLKDGKSFTSKSDSAYFSREGDIKPFKDTIILNGNIECSLNGMEIVAENLQLVSNGETYTINSDSNIEVSSGTYTIETGSFNFDAVSGIGSFPNGADLNFTIDSPEESEKTSLDLDIENNIFGQCLRIDTNGGHLFAPEMTLEYERDEFNYFRPVIASMKSGGELTPLYPDSDNNTNFKFGYLVFNMKDQIIDAKDKIWLVNGPCEIKSDIVHIDMPNRILQMADNIVVSRDLIKFQCGLLDISWDEDGRISLVAKSRPSMSVTIPDETVRDAMN